MLQALGARFLDKDEKPLLCGRGGKYLRHLGAIDLKNLKSRLRFKKVRIDFVCNWENELCGDHGVAPTYGPQKGATPEQVKELSEALDQYAVVLKGILGRDISTSPGSGASGGLGAALLLLNANPRKRYDAFVEYFGIGDIFKSCDVLFTAEGAIDYQTPRGKMTAEVSRRAKEKDIRVIALAGTVGQDAGKCYEAGIDAFASILQAPCTLEEVKPKTKRLLEDQAEYATRLLRVGMSIERKYLDPSADEIKAALGTESLSLQSWLTNSTLVNGPRR